ncbi:hypothetical protein HN652_02645 [archaeon]|nr:hypothetical protein [archaeon]
MGLFKRIFFKNRTIQNAETYAQHFRGSKRGGRSFSSCSYNSSLWG